MLLQANPNSNMSNISNVLDANFLLRLLNIESFRKPCYTSRHIPSIRLHFRQLQADLSHKGFCRAVSVAGLNSYVSITSPCSTSTLYILRLSPPSTAAVSACSVQASIQS